jgi:hypothetical protein
MRRALRVATSGELAASSSSSSSFNSINNTNLNANNATTATTATGATANGVHATATTMTSASTHLHAQMTTLHSSQQQSTRSGSNNLTAPPNDDRPLLHHFGPSIKYDTSPFVAKKSTVEALTRSTDDCNRYALLAKFGVDSLDQHRFVLNKSFDIVHNSLSLSLCHCTKA